MAIKIFNTLTGKKEEFIPKSPGEVKMYVCGPTVYNYIHIGNARVYVFFDAVKRFFEHQGYRVTCVSNFTDIDDKIINRAREEGISFDEVARKYETAFLEDVRELGLLSVEVKPRATEHIDGMIDMIKKLMEKGYAYKAGDDVFFSVEKFKGYGKLSGRTLEEMRAGERIDPSPHKKFPLDFVLWKASKPGEPAWESPWGFGRPGWHIECSVMSIEYLGFGFDIHGGGQDLIFPHHENEIAQAEASFGKSPFVRYWMHNGLLTIKSEKMAKSLGNIIPLREAIKNYGPDTLKVFYFSTHYRSPLDYSEERLEEAKKSLERISDCLASISVILDMKEDISSEISKEKTKALKNQILTARKEFVSSMEDDFNTARAMAAVFALVRELNIAVSDYSILPEIKTLNRGAKEIKSLLSILGIDMDRFEKFVEEKATSVITCDYAKEVISLAQVYGINLENPDEAIEELVKLREIARQNRNYEVSDAIRERLMACGIEIMDTPLGPRWKMKT